MPNAPKRKGSGPEPKPKTWRDLLSEKARDDVELAQYYVERYNRGTDGHQAKNTIAWLAAALDDLEAAGVDTLAILDP